MLALLIGVGLTAYVVWWTIRDHRRHKLSPEHKALVRAFHQEFKQAGDDLVRVLYAEAEKGGRP